MKVNPVVLEDTIEPFAFDLSQAPRYLLQSTSIDLSADSLKKAFRKSPKSEVLTLHVMREKVALQGQINAMVAHRDFYSMENSHFLPMQKGYPNPNGYYRDE